MASSPGRFGDSSIPARRHPGIRVARRFRGLPLHLIGVLLAVTACGGSPAAERLAEPRQIASPAAEAKCEAVAGTELVILADDRDLQTVENIVPAMSLSAAQMPALPAILNNVNGALETAELVGLSRVESAGSSAAEQTGQYVADKGLNDLGRAEFSRPIVIGEAPSSESKILANIYAVALSAAGADVRIVPVRDREDYLPQLIAGSIDVVPEYVGTLTEYLNRQVNGVRARPVASSDLGSTVRRLRELGREAGIAIGAPSPASNANAFAVTAAFAERYDVRTLSELADNCGEVTLGGPPECLSLSFCRPGLEERYGLEVSAFLPLDVGGPETKAALRRGAVMLALVFTLDGSLHS